MSAPGSGATPPQDVVSERYELLDQLGAGGMASVWHARDRVLRRDVAVKVFNVSLAQDEHSPDELDRATQEARLLAGMSHPHLVAVLDAGGATPERLDYLVMELVAGPTLRDRIHRQTVRPDDVLRLGAELSAVLAYVHERGVVHRDLKPANILFDSYDGTAQPKIADFGVARLLSAAPLTSSGKLVGTAAYLSPEQATGARVGTASDVYALGLVLLECVTGAPAYEGAGVATAAARLHHDPDVSGVPDPRTRRLLSAMTSREPGDRPDALTAADAFDALASGDTARFDRLPLVAGVPPAAAFADQSTEAMAPPTQIAPTATTEVSAPVMPVEPVAPVVAAVPAADAPPPAHGPPPERRRSRVVPIVVVAGVLLAALLFLGAGLLGSDDRSPSPEPSSPSARATETTSSKSSKPTTSPTSRASESTSSDDDPPASTDPAPTRTEPEPSKTTKAQPTAAPTSTSTSAATASPRSTQGDGSTSKASPSAAAAP